MRVELRNPGELDGRLTGTVEEAKDMARSLSELFERLDVLGNRCVGMRVKIGKMSLMVMKDGDTFVLADDRVKN